MKVRLGSIFLAMLVMLALNLSAQNPCNPCGKKAANPCNPCGKAAKAKAPAVNPCHAKMGKVFYVSDAMGRDSITFTSRAPLEDITGTSNRIVGYVAFDPEDPKKGGAGQFTVPVSSLTTGIPLRDEHLHSEMWLDSQNHPEVKLVIKKVRNVRKSKSGGITTFTAVLDGELSLHGQTRKVQVRGARFAYLPESDRTKARAPGDLLKGQASFTVNLKDFKIKGMEGVIGSKVSEKISVGVSFVGSTKAGSANPCNPCNPCAKKRKTN